MNIRNTKRKSDPVNGTHAAQVFAGTKTSLRETKGQDVTNIRTLPCGMLYHLHLLYHEGSKIGLGWLNYVSHDPLSLFKPIKRLPEQIAGIIFLPANDDIKTEATQALPNEETRSHGRQNVANRVFRDLTGYF